MRELIATIEGFSLEGILLRLVMATVAGSVIGLEREFKNKRAGLKTHALVCLGAALCMVVSEYVSIGRDALTTDAARIGANVVTGVGFLGAATIMVGHTGEVRGLTTAAGIWTCAVIGLTAGAGYVEVTVAAVILVLFVLLVLSRLDARIEQASRHFDAYIELGCSSDVRRLLGELRVRGVHFSNLRVRRGDLGGESVTLTLSASTARLGQKQRVIEELRHLGYVTYLESY